MKAMKWLLSVAVAAAIVVPLQSANAEGGGPYSGGDPYQSYRVHYRGDGYDGGYRGPDRGYRGDYGHHRHYHRPHRYYGPLGYYRGDRHYSGGPGYYGRPWVGHRGPVVVAPPPPPPFPW